MYVNKSGKVGKQDGEQDGTEWGRDRTGWGAGLGQNGGRGGIGE